MGFEALGTSCEMLSKGDVDEDGSSAQLGFWPALWAFMVSLSFVKSSIHSDPASTMRARLAEMLSSLWFMVGCSDDMMVIVDGVVVTVDGLVCVELTVVLWVWPSGLIKRK